MNQRQVGLGWASTAIIFGIILPAVTLAIELRTGMCARDLFNPLPTPLHVVLVGLVPLTTLVSLVAIQWLPSRYLPWFAALNGFAGGITLYYSVAFLPVLPLALIGLMLAGLGLLPLSPHLALVAHVLMVTKLIKLSEGRLAVVPAYVIGFLLFVGTLLAADYRVARMELLIARAYSADRETRTEAIRALREPQYHRALYESATSSRSRNIAGPITLVARSRSGARGTRTAAEELFFRATGTTVAEANIEAAPRSVLFDEWPPEPSLNGGEVVGAEQAGLGLKASSLEGDFYGDSGVGYVEWTMTVRNNRDVPQEARMRLQLPPGAAVSRVSLKIGGDWREAAFGKSEKVRQAYQQVVRVERRDPLLVTSSAPDRVLVQCFPVPARGEMDIRLGFTLPAILRSRTEGTFHLPRILEQNFSLKRIAGSTVLWLQGPQNIELSELPTLGFSDDAAFCAKLPSRSGLFTPSPTALKAQAGKSRRRIRCRMERDGSGRGQWWNGKGNGFFCANCIATRTGVRGTTWDRGTGTRPGEAPAARGGEKRLWRENGSGGEGSFGNWCELPGAEVAPRNQEGAVFRNAGSQAICGICGRAFLKRNHPVPGTPANGIAPVMLKCNQLRINAKG